MLSVIRKIWLWSWKSKWSCFFLVSFFFQGLSDMCTPTQYMSVSCCRLWSHDSRTDVTGRWQGRVDPWRRLRHHKYLWCHWGMCSSSAWRWGMCLCLNFFLSLSLSLSFFFFFNCTCSSVCCGLLFLNTRLYLPVSLGKAHTFLISNCALCFERMLSTVKSALNFRLQSWVAVCLLYQTLG